MLSHQPLQIHTGHKGLPAPESSLRLRINWENLAGAWALYFKKES